jgi:hypothetical protein
MAAVSAILFDLMRSLGFSAAPYVADVPQVPIDPPCQAGSAAG